MPNHPIDGDFCSILPLNADQVEDSAHQAFGADRPTASLVKNRELSGQALNQAILKEEKFIAAEDFQDDVLLMSVALK